MNVESGSEFEVLHALRVKGLAREQVLAALSGVPTQQLAQVCAPLVESGLVLRRAGAMAGYMLTAAGKQRAQELLAADPATIAGRPALAAFDVEFLPGNTDFKQLCHRWQVRPDGTPNDHADAAYDDAVVADLAAFHDGFVPTLDRIAGALPRFGRYAPRLTAALGRLQGGDAGAFARPLYDSYHDIWMELHNDVVLSLGRTRGAADEH